MEGFVGFSVVGLVWVFLGLMLFHVGKVLLFLVPLSAPLVGFSSSFPVRVQEGRKDDGIRGGGCVGSARWLHTESERGGE